MAKKVTIEDILKKKGLIKEEQRIFYSNMFEGEIEIKSINAEEVLEIMSEENSEITKYQKLIYLSCPFFADKNLQEQLNVKDPFDTVKAVYGDNICEVLELGNVILSRYGFTRDKVENVKKH